MRFGFIISSASGRSSSNFFRKFQFNGTLNGRARIILISYFLWFCVALFIRIHFICTKCITFVVFALHFKFCSMIFHHSSQFHVESYTKVSQKPFPSSKFYLPLYFTQSEPTYVTALAITINRDCKLNSLNIQYDHLICHSSRISRYLDSYL